MKSEHNIFSIIEKNELLLKNRKYSAKEDFARSDMSENYRTFGHYEINTENKNHD